MLPWTAILVGWLVMLPTGCGSEVVTAGGGGSTTTATSDCGPMPEGADCMDPCTGQMYAPFCLDGSWTCGSEPDDCGECGPMPSPGYCWDECAHLSLEPYCVDGAWTCPPDSCGTDGWAQWSIGWGNDGWDQADAIAILPDGSIVVAAMFYGTLDVVGQTVDSQGGSDVLIAKLSTDGDVDWLHAFGGPGAERVGGLAVDGTGHIVVASFFDGVVDFGDGPLDSAAGSLALLKLTSDGALAWSRQLAVGTTDGRIEIACDSQDAMVLAGGFEGSAQLGGPVLQSAGGWDVFAGKLDPDGNHLWSQRFGDGGHQHGTAVAVTAAGNVLVTGGFRQSLDFGAGVMTSAGEFDAFVAALSPEGAPLWSRSFGGPTRDEGMGIAAADDGGATLVGVFSGTADLGAGPVQASGLLDGFLARITVDGEHGWSVPFQGVTDNPFGTERWRVAHAAGEILLAGQFEGSTDIAEPAISAGQTDLVISKFSSAGAHLWGSSFGGYNSEHVLDAAIAPEGWFAIAGRQWSGPAFDLGDGPHESSLEGSAFVAKFPSGPPSEP